MSDIDGGLVGGASLKPDEFSKIVNAQNLKRKKRTYSFTEKMEIGTLNNFAISLAKFNTKELEEDENEEKKG